MSFVGPLGLSRLELHAFLKERGVQEHAYGVDDLDRDLDDLRTFEARQSARRS